MLLHLSLQCNKASPVAQRQYIKLSPLVPEKSITEGNGAPFLLGLH